MYNYRRHPLVIPMGAIRSLWAAILPILFSFGQAMHKGEGFSFLTNFGILIGLILLLLIFEFLKWRSFTYEWNDKEIRIASGIWTKTKTSVPRSAITAVDRSANPIMKLCGLVTLKLETAAGGKEADVILSYIPDHLAEEWLEEEQHSHTAYRFTGKELFLYGASSPATLVAMGAVIGLLSDFWSPDHILEKKEWWKHQELWLWIAGLAGAVLLLWIIASLVVASKYYGFTLERNEGVLTISKGLWNRRTMRIRAGQIQSLVLMQHPLQALFGYVSVRVHLTSSGDEDGSFDNVLFPLLKKRDLNSWITYYTPEYTLPLGKTPLPRQFQRAPIWRNIIMTAWTLLLFFWKAWTLWITIPLILIAAGLGYLQGKTAAWDVTDYHIAFTSQRFAKWTAIIPMSRVQCVKIYTTPFGRQRGYSTIAVHHMSSFVGHAAELSYVPTPVAKRIVSLYQMNRRKKVIC